MTPHHQIHSCIDAGFLVLVFWSLGLGLGLMVFGLASSSVCFVHLNRSFVSLCFVVFGLFIWLFSVVRALVHDQGVSCNLAQRASTIRRC